MRKIHAISVLMAVLLALCLVSCGNSISTDEANQHIEDFFASIQADDYTKAEGMLHPERPADIKTFFEGLEEQLDVDFSDGFEIQKRNGVKIVMYDGTVGGATYAVQLTVKIGDLECYIYIELVRNDAGFGIYNFEIKDLKNA